MKIVIKIVSIITLCLASSGVWAQTNTRVTGKLKGLEAGTMVYLRPANSSKKHSVVAGKGSFEFDLALEEGDVYDLKVGKEQSGDGNFNSTELYLQPGEVKIKGKTTEMYNAKLSGSKFADEQNDLKKYLKNAEELKKYKSLLAELEKARENKDAVREAALLTKSIARGHVEKELSIKWAMDHPSSPASTRVLWGVNEKDPDKLQKFLNHLQPAAKQNALAKDMQYQLERTILTAIGKPAPGFVQNDTSGKAVALKDFRGKYVLIDFWASWCVPCRQENPNVVKAYNKLKDKNFTILGVSLDQSNAKDKWLKAIRDDKLTWTHVSDLKSWDNAVARLYGIRAVPSNLLIGPDGVILAKNLSGAMLEEQLRKYIK